MNDNCKKVSELLTAQTMEFALDEMAAMEEMEGKEETAAMAVLEETVVLEVVEDTVVEF